MAVNDFNVGSDTTLSLIVNGQILRSAILTSFEARQITASLNSTAIDGVNRYDEIEKGWEGTLDYDRADSILDDFFAAKEAGRYSGARKPTVSITETTTNVDGTVVKYRYPRCALKLDTIGARKGDAKVEPKVSFKCGRRIKVQ
ncbi:hypothetical protein PQR71_39860 [Paraburkholderia fungorum]|uniref:hypothetical protein n=1 Tax=Paraburkholderia fungorum TaxID=134537 RepID=UPI0038B947B0